MGFLLGLGIGFVSGFASGALSAAAAIASIGRGATLPIKAPDHVPDWVEEMGR